MRTLLLAAAVLIGLQLAASAATQKPQARPEIRSRAAAAATPSPKKPWYYAALEVNYVALNTLDLLTTFRGLDAGAREVNPATRWLVHNKPMSLAFKGAATAGVLFGLNHIRKQDKTLATVLLGALNLFYGAVVANNVHVTMQITP